MPVSFDAPNKPAARRSATSGGSPPAPPPRRWVAVAVPVAATLGLAAAVGLALATETRSELVAPGGIATFAGSFTGLVGTYLALVMVLLVSRLPAVERALGQDSLLRWHRRLGPWPITLLFLHAVLITVGYAEAARSGIGKEIAVLLDAYPDVLAATVALGLMMMAGFASVRALRRRLKRETWWAIHLYMYMALALSFAHVIMLGPAFVGHPLVRIVWSAIWAATGGVVLVSRIGTPILRSVRHRLRVHEVRPEAPGVISVICSGRDLHRLAVSGGQFFEWRFLCRELWWQAHPYSLSALPRPPYLRLTVKAVGDHSSSLAGLKRGTRVAIEGPYGTFRVQSQRRSKAALIAAGIGVTALRSLLEDLPRRSEPVVVLRASSETDLVFRSEMSELVRHRKGTLHELLGRRDEVLLDDVSLAALVPDLAQRDVYVCGPPEFVERIVATATRLGVDRQAIHHEAFAL